MSGYIVFFAFAPTANVGQHLLTQPEIGNKIALKVKIKFLECSEFQKIVWKELLKINHGRTISYSEVANLILYPKAVRAVASAVGKNPISIIVPCHRVIRKNGMIGDYVWGVKMKRALLDVEV